MSVRIKTLIAPLNETQLIIFGGEKDGKYSASAHVYDVQKRSVSKVLQGGFLGKVFATNFKFYGRENQCMQTKNGQVVALVKNQWNELHVI